MTSCNEAWDYFAITFQMKKATDILSSLMLAYSHENYGKTFRAGMKITMNRGHGIQSNKDQGVRKQLQLAHFTKVLIEFKWK